MQISEAVKQLLSIVDALSKTYGKAFTLDGRLVGDIGETLVSQDYDVKLYDISQKHYDGETSDGRKVQIKATMKNSLGFPHGHTPDYYIGIKIKESGSYDVVYNGDGKTISQSIAHLARPKNNLHNIGIEKLKNLNEQVLTENRIPLRVNS